ncbi:MAG TPA: DUF2279 domain-containing protein, partial [Saprospiraceae bacterium]|nr:DUF2279 domain-containing protein [Saprospiraceae bacterium]
MMKAYSVLAILLSITSLLKAQDSLTNNAVVNQKRLKTLIIAGGAGYGLTLYGLDKLWYNDSEQQSFQFFDDNDEWKQVDKLGHFYSAFYFSYGTSKALQWCNVPKKKSDLYGALTGFLVMVPIEILDGYSDAYGASSGDLIADAGGALFYLGQTMLWKEPRILPKFSFHTTHYATMRPEVLGNDYSSEMLKDYNGQTYWLSFDMDKFIKFPKWLNIAAGYGAEGMVYANDRSNEAMGYHSYRQYYLSLD